MRASRLLLTTFALACALAAAPARGRSEERGGPRPIRLREVLGVAVRHNPTLAKTTIDVALAEADRLAAAGLDDWILTANLSWVTNRRELVEDQPFQILADDTLSGSTGITRGLPSGGTFGVELDSSVSDTKNALLDSDAVAMDTPFPDNFVTYDGGRVSGAATATLSHPLLRGFGKRIARAPQRRAELAKNAAALSREIAAQDIVLDVVSAYWELAYATRVLDIHLGTLALAREQLRITQAAIDAGAAARSEIFAVEQAIAVREEAILLAEVAVAERSIELRRLAGLEIGAGEILLAATDAPATGGRAFDLDAALRRAEARNPQLALLRVNGKGATLEVEVTQDGLRPQLDLVATTGTTGAANEAGETVRQLTGLDAFSATATLTYTQTLGNRAARGAHARAQGSARRVRIELAEAQREIAVATVRAVNLVRAAGKRVEVSEKSIQLAGKNLEVERARFQAGKATNFAVLERQEEIEQAELSHARALVDYQQAIAAVDSLTGDLLARHGLAVLEGEDD
jgi:outer membrane protein TolC